MTGNINLADENKSCKDKKTKEDNERIKEIAYQAIRAYELGAKLGIQLPIA